MPRVLRCSEVMEGCEAIFRGQTDDEVMAQARAHAENDHRLTEHPPQKVAEVRGKIRDE